MSQGPSAQRPSSSQRHDNRYQTLAPLESRTLPPIVDGSRARAPNAGEAVQMSARATPAQSPVEQKYSRSLGMQNILNPASKESPEEQIRQRRTEHRSLPSPATTAASHPPSTSMTPSPGSVSLPSITPPSMNTYLPPMGGMPRPNVTPRSASAYPVNPITKPMTATIDAKASPFLRSNDPTSSSMPENTHQPSVLPSTGGPFGTALPPPRSPPGRRPSGGSQLTGAMDRRASLAGSDSPSTTYSSYSHFSRTPPAVQTLPPTAQPSSAFYGVPYSGPHGHPLPHGAYAHSNTNGPVSSASATAGQSSYQMMTLETDQGPIQVPVDVQAASKVADEKRKRNATASHRFRQRRKEKERETSNSIQQLQNQIKEVEEEREHYRKERDFFRGVVWSSSSGSGRTGETHPQVANRPLSPRVLRRSSASSSGRGGGSVGQENYEKAQWHHPPPSPSSLEREHGGRNTRRRTSSYVPVNDLAPQQQQQQQLPPAPPAQQQQQQQHGQQGRGYPQLQPQPQPASNGPQRGGGGGGAGHHNYAHHAATWHPNRR
ncbi:MAG: hypothetical protein Q9174_004439 [Haloplaca sp. 1 TL-2023]